MSKLSMPLEEYSHILKVEKGPIYRFYYAACIYMVKPWIKFSRILEHPLKFRILFRDWFLGGQGLTSNSQAYH